MNTEYIITKLYLYGLHHTYDEISILKYAKTLKVLRRYKQAKL